MALRADERDSTVRDGTWSARSASALLALLLTGALAACARVAAPATTIAQSSTTTVTSLPNAPVCQPSQLATAYAPTGGAGGDRVGDIFIWNASPGACSLAGGVGFDALDTQGAPIPNSQRDQPSTLSKAVLPPNTPPPAPDQSRVAGAYLSMLITGVYRDDPSAPNGVCAPANEVTPAWFVVTVGALSLRVANQATLPNPPDTEPMAGCHGAIAGGNLLLS